MRVPDNNNQRSNSPIRISNTERRRREADDWGKPGEIARRINRELGLNEDGTVPQNTLPDQRN